MMKRLLRHPRTEPARTILIVVAFVTAVLQALTLTPWIDPPIDFTEALPNAIIVWAVCTWCLIAGAKNHIKQMATASFWLFAMWFWSALARVIVGLPDIDLRFGGYLTTSLALAVVYLYLAHQKRDSERPQGIEGLD